ncbi:MAG: sodium:dicarboxylate symporter [Gammaproteobacteria bacterium]|nr:MAG: sodium:dicarboxylate symporter [Gammaproteobacteria bacterium]
MVATKLYSKLSPFQRVIIALILGILTGIFVGEPAGILKVGGTIYIRLLQMTVLPYVLVSIIGGLGRLDAAMAANIGIKAVKIILFMWLAVMITLLLLPLAYPSWETAGFFSTSMVTESVTLDFVALYIPSNVFAALSNTIVPAVVLFSLLMGVAVIAIKNKESLINLTDNISDGLQGVASFIAKLAPLGIFAIAASAAGTLQPEELERLQVFLWVYLIAAFLLGFVLLPLLVHWATPFSYRELMSVAGEAMITALATGTVLVVLPMIAERCKELLKRHDMECEETDSTVDVLVPTAYSFPSTGTLLGLGFILFSAWYVGSPLSLGQYPSYVFMGAFSAFGSMAVAIPFLLDYYGLPADQFQLYLLGSVVTARFATGLAALHGFVVTLLVASAVLNRLSWRKMMQAVALHLGVTAGVVILVGIGLTKLIPYEYSADKSFESMKFADDPVLVKTIKSPLALNAQDQAKPRLDIIRDRGSIRVGYSAENLPFAFRNDQGLVVGFDMELMNELAWDLGITIELFYVKDIKQGPQMLSDGRVDIIVGGRLITPLRALDVSFSDHYIQKTVAFMVKDNRREEFSSVDQIRMIENLHIGLEVTAHYKYVIEKMFPNAELTIVDGPRKYFKGEYPDVDALTYSAEAGSAWAMLYPDYSSVVAKGLKIKIPVGFALPKAQQDYTHFINTWLQLKRDSGYLQSVYDYWILGRNPKAVKPRWSVMHDVLGWSTRPAAF